MAVFSLAIQAKSHSSYVTQRFLSISRVYFGLSACACSKRAAICVPSLRTSKPGGLDLIHSRSLVVLGVCHECHV